MEAPDPNPVLVQWTSVAAAGQTVRPAARDVARRQAWPSWRGKARRGEARICIAWHRMCVRVRLAWLG
eukprot:364124-Chlamydomonas_euryale.AAC.2